ncbi:uncharacterized protein LOC124921819 [Impatiens glandulifera]|uniref:uncharacterized protein LOC124921819 n=1 Tax=Impatiens glandulifera TaxID=253017 RepID=UPI001FB08144|nr:uncharacterized protein LOC124921819 [Impatiens glandulifera]
MKEEDDERRETAMASAPSLQPNFKSSITTKAQISKFQELHKRRLQIKAKTIEKKKKDKKKPLLDEISCASNYEEEILSREEGSSSPSVSIENPAELKKRKLHWGLDTKERWERKANM